MFTLNENEKNDTKLKILIKNAATKRRKKSLTEQKKIMSKTLIQLAELLAAKRMFNIFNVKQMLPQIFASVWKRR